MIMLELNGLNFRVEFQDDFKADRPWDQCDGHGPVRQATRGYDGHIIKRPGERVLYAGERGEYSWVYDWQAACKLARQDRWNAAPYDAPDRIQRAVQNDFDYLQSWCNGQWSYVGVTVTHIKDDGTEGESESVWGVETLNDYHIDTAKELAQGLADTILAEQAQVREWAERDVVTA